MSYAARVREFTLAFFEMPSILYRLLRGFYQYISRLSVQELFTYVDGRMSQNQPVQEAQVAEAEKGMPYASMTSSQRQTVHLLQLAGPCWSTFIDTSLQNVDSCKDIMTTYASSIQGAILQFVRKTDMRSLEVLGQTCPTSRGTGESSFSVGHYETALILYTPVS